MTNYLAYVPPLSDGFCRLKAAVHFYIKNFGSSGRVLPWAFWRFASDYGTAILNCESMAMLLYQGNQYCVESQVLGNPVIS